MCDKLDKIRELGNKLEDEMRFVNALMAALETSNEGIAILNDKGEYTYLNRAHEEMFGYEPGEMLGKSWEILYRPDQIQYFKQTVFPIVAKQGRWHGKDVGLAKDGSEVNESVYLTALPDGGLICTCIKIEEDA